MTTATSAFYLPAGGSGSDYDVEVTPESAGWGYSSLRIVSLDAAGEHRFATDDDEIVVRAVERRRRGRGRRVAL